MTDVLDREPHGDEPTDEEWDAITAQRIHELMKEATGFDGKPAVGLTIKANGNLVVELPALEFERGAEVLAALRRRVDIGKWTVDVNIFARLLYGELVEADGKLVFKSPF